MGSIENSPPSTRRIYLLTSPRTASNLFVKILNLDRQPEIATSDFLAGYLFMDLYNYRDHIEQWHVPYDELPEEHKRGITKITQASVEKYYGLLDSAERSGKMVFIKEHINYMMDQASLNQHIHGITANVPNAWVQRPGAETDYFSPFNPTFIPDNILLTFHPCFLIRHPAIQFPSLLRIQTADRNGVCQTPSRRAIRSGMYHLKTVRQLHDFYDTYFRSQDPSSPWPLVIDGGEFITHPATVMEHFCNLTGLDFANCKFNWGAASSETLGGQKRDTHRRALETLNASSGIIQTKAQLDIDVGVEVEKWREEFGSEMADELERHVRAALPDYEYLWATRWSPVEIGASVVETDSAMKVEKATHSSGVVEVRA